MKSISVQDLGGAGALAKRLREDEELLVMSGDKPIAVMVAADEASFESRLMAFRRARFKESLAEIQRDAVARGLDNITMEEIDAEIAACRKESASDVEGRH